MMAGGLVAMLGVAVRALASGHITKNAALTTSGPYAVTRNPLYLGSIIIAAGFSIAGRSEGIVLIMVLLFLLVYLPVIRSEETFLAAQFPEYARYAQEVPRLWPRLGRWRAAASGFSRERYWRHREYNALLGALAMLAALAVKMVARQ